MNEELAGEALEPFKGSKRVIRTDDNFYNLLPLDSLTREVHQRLAGKLRRRSCDRLLLYQWETNF